MAKCDNELREIEYKFLLTIAQTLNVSQDDFDNLFEKTIEFTPPESEFDRILQFHRLVLLMNIDQETSEVELEFLRDVGIRMGLNSIATDQVLAIMDNYPNKVIPNEKLIEVFRGHYN